MVLQKIAYDPYCENYTEIAEIPEPPEKIRELAEKYGEILYKPLLLRSVH